MGAFVVHGRNHRNNGFSVGEGKNGNFRAGEEFFDYDVIAAFSENFVFHHGMNSFNCGFSGFGNNYAFSKRKTVSFDNGGDGCGFKIFKSGFHIVKYFVFSGGNSVFFHKVFGENLAAFDDCSVCSGAEARDSFCFKSINCSENKRIVRSNNCVIDVMGNSEFNDCVDIFCADCYAFGIGGDAAVARKRIDFCNFAVFFDFFDYCMFAAAAANY